MSWLDFWNILYQRVSILNYLFYDVNFSLCQNWYFPRIPYYFYHSIKFYYLDLYDISVLILYSEPIVNKTYNTPG